MLDKLVLIGSNLGITTYIIGIIGTLTVTIVYLELKRDSNPFKIILGILMLVIAFLCYLIVVSEILWICKTVGLNHS